MNPTVRFLVRAKGLEPPQAFTYQDLNLGEFVPSSPILYQRVGLQSGCSPRCLLPAGGAARNEVGCPLRYVPLCTHRGSKVPSRRRSSLGMIRCL